MRKLYLLFLVFFTMALVSKALAHSVQVAYCVSCTGKLRLYVEHWHSTESVASTTMTIETTVNGITTSSTGSPVANLQDIPFAQLPDCASPPVIFASCPGQANTYNDWVVYDFPSIAAGSSVVIKIISGNSAFTEDGCGMFPATSNSFIVTPINQPSFTIPSINMCSGTVASETVFPPGTPSGGTYIWTNNNTSIGIPASGTGNIPAFTPPPSSTTQVATISVDYLCASTTFTITVLPSAGPNFNYANIAHNGAIQCLGDSTIFEAQTATGVNIQSVLWDFGDGTTSTLTNPIHLFQNLGNYTVNLKVTTTGGCIQTSSSVITINPKPVASYTSSPECEYDAVNFTNTSTVSVGSIGASQWLFGDGGTSSLLSPSHLYPGDGSYPVGLVVTSVVGCKDSIVGTQIVYEKPFATFTKTETCENTPTLFTDASTASVSLTNWDWDYQNDGVVDNTTQNTSYTYPSFGSYVVALKVTDANGCVDDTTLSVIVNPLPTAAFTSTEECPNFPILLTNGSTVGGGATITAWNWDIGNDGNVDYQTQNSTESWTLGGAYQVELMVETADGCKDSIVNTVNVFPKPEAAFSNTTVCYGTATSFTDNSIVALNNSFTSWEWDFDDGSVSTTQNPAHTFGVHGFYDVTLMVETNNGCRDTLVNKIQVYAAPIVDFSMPNVCEYDKVNFTNNTTIPGGGAMTYLWNFGDNTTFVGETATHLYANEGIYNVKLKATSVNGCVHDSTISVQIYDEPAAQFSLVNGCVYQDFTFTDHTFTSSTVSSWEWDFSDGGTANSQSPTHHFNSEGIYPIELIVTTTELCKDTITLNLEVYPKPIAAFTPTDVCLATPTVFDDISVVSTQVFPNESILPYSGWSFGDGTVASGLTAVHTYNTAGTYTAKITVTTNHGCKDTASLAVTVHSNPVASFITTDSTGCSPVTANFINTSTITNNPGTYSLTYTWYLGNGTIATTDNTSSVFVNESHTNIKYYGASLVATSNYGCKDSIFNNRMVTVYPIPDPEFSFTPDETTVYNTTIDFTDESVGASKWFWRFGDGSTGNNQHPTHRYADSGSYTIDLIIENGYKCTDSISKKLRINPVFEVYIPNSFTPNGDGINDVFMVEGYGITEQELYIFDRWGQMMYEGFNVGDSWDGNVKGKLDKTAVYVYVVKVVDLYGKTHNYKGSVTLIK